MTKIMKHILSAGFAVILVVSLGCLDTFGTDSSDSSKWAVPVKVKGVPGLFRVTPDLYRSGQPTLEGLRNLKAMGIKTVINLRDFHSDRDEVLAAGLQYERIHTKAWFPMEDGAVRFLKIVTDPKRTPVLVHCWLSSDRSGAMVAIYRIAIQGWSKEAAIKEMTEGDYGFHKILIDLPIWVKEANIERIKRRAGIKSTHQEINQDQQQK
jgi:tyrosine-protein phosphatase SIW14